MNRSRSLGARTLAAGIAALILTSSTLAQPPGGSSSAQTVSFWKAADAFAKTPLLLDRMDSNHYQIYAVRRDAPGGVELHALDTDIILVLEGSATFVVEGTIDAARSRGPNEMTGTGITDGKSFRLGKGDVIVVPNGTPHWFRETSPFIRYFAVKLRQASVTPAPSAVRYWTGSEAFTKGGLLFDGTEGRFVRVYALRRDKPLGVEVHTVDTDAVFVVGGTGAFVTGGTVSEPRALGPNESTGTGILSGIPRQVGPGDVLVLPNRTPHWLRDIEGTLDFFAVKLR